MKRTAQTVPEVAFLIVLIGLLGTCGAYVWTIFQGSWSGARRELPVYSQVPDFTLTNQVGQVITLANLRGQPWVADVIFTRCAGPCPKLSSQMSRLQTALTGKARVQLVSLTADPQHDTPQVLERYGQRYSNESRHWWFLTGDRSQIQRVAVQGLKLAAGESTTAVTQPGEDLFIHSTKLVLIDRAGQVRGYYDGTEPDTQDRILKDLAVLAREKHSG